MNIIAFYLPQFHEIPENNEWWGEGFTEWVNMKKAKPLFDDHYQPRIPLNKNYYDLSKQDVLHWQAETAKKYGVNGFCFYHYWFGEKMLLEKPAEMLLQDKSIDIQFCFSWANESWTKAWADKKDAVLIEQTYGDEAQWIKHIEYLLPFFKDERYIKEDGKPLFIIYRPELIPELNEMLDLFDKVAKENGFPGIVFAYQQVSFYLDKNKDDSRFKYNIEYQPIYARALQDLNNKKVGLRRIGSKFIRGVEKTTHVELRANIPQNVKKYDYDKTWDYILNMNPGPKSIPGAFVDWDNTPRRQNRGMVYLGGSPEKFRNYFSKLIRRAEDVYKKDYIFIFAWNEWAEGGYLEPDEKYKFRYLEAIKDSLKENKLFED